MILTMQELQQRLERAGLPVAYRQFPRGKAPPPPYLCYLLENTSSFYADNHVYEIVQLYGIELYTVSKRPDLELAVETALSGLGWEKTEEYLDDEKCYQIIYEIEV